MNPYAMLGSAVGTNDASSLGVRLSSWHDAMVAHERRLRMNKDGDGCDDECPHAEAGALWSEAVTTFGPRANELTFLRARAKQSAGPASGRLTPRRAAEASDQRSRAMASTAWRGES
jgi:hypothetical protein